MHKQILLRTTALVLAACCCVLLPACSKDAASGAMPEGSTPEVVELTKQVRRFSFENRRVPRDLEELRSAGYIKAVPTAPAGKKYAIDGKKAVVLLVDQ